MKQLSFVSKQKWFITIWICSIKKNFFVFKDTIFQIMILQIFSQQDPALLISYYSMV